MKKITYIILLVSLLFTLGSCKDKKPKPITVTSITPISTTDFTFYEGEFDPSTISLEVKKSDSSITNTPLSYDLIISDLTNIKVGTNAIKVKIEDYEFSFNINIIVKPVVIKSITPLNENDFTYFEGEFVSSSITLKVENSNDSINNIVLLDSMIISDITNLHIGNNIIKASYNDFEFFLTIIIKEKIINDLNYNYELNANKTGYIITEYLGNDEHIIIPSLYNKLPVIEIADEVFLNNEDIVSVLIPNSITSIGTAAFYKCENLKSIYIPNSVQTINDYALSGVRVIFLENNEINNEWSSKWYDIKTSSIIYSVNSSDITRDDKYEYISNEYVTITNYYGDESNIIIPNTYNNLPVEVIGGHSFAENQNVVSVVIPNTVTKIYEYAFINCPLLEAVTLSNKLTYIGQFVFGRCELLDNVILPSTLITIDTGAFNSCYALTTLTIPDTVTHIGSQAFDWCTSMTAVYIHDTLTYIDENAFYACSKLHIYTEFKSLPSTWHERFNPSGRPITWNYEIK